jgi:D-galactarolactone cycloisomerase
MTHLIERIELYHVAIPLKQPFYPSWIPGYPQTANRFDLIRLTTDTGIDGWSAAPAMGRERQGFGELIAPYLIGSDATDIPRIQQRLREMGYLGLRNFWIEPACWDIKGKAAGMPVYKLLGAEGGRIPVYASTGEVKTPTERVAEVHARYAEGFRAVKLRVHDFDEKRDIAQVEAVMREFGGKMKVGVDCNQAWRITAMGDAPLWDLPRAKRFADACADLGVAWVEEPLPMDAYADQAELARYSRVPIAGGELHTGGLAELKMMIERGCYHWYQPDAMFTGGIAQTIDVMALCRLHGVRYTPHTWTNGIGFAVNLQLMAIGGDRVNSFLEYPINPPSWTPELRDGLLTQTFTQRDGYLELPTTPGLGFEIDRTALRRYGRRFFAMGKTGLAWHAIRQHGLRTALAMKRSRSAGGGI